MQRPAAWAVAVVLASAAAARAAIVAETYTHPDAFAARLGGAVRTIGFDDVDTSADDPAAFASDRYAPLGLLIEGQAGQFASRDFGFPDDYLPTSPPNVYAPGPMESLLGGGNASEVRFVAGDVPATVAGFGAVFVDPDLPTSTLAVFDDEGELLGTVAVPEADGGRAFRGIVTVDDGTDAPVPAIARVEIVNGTGWPAADFNDGVPLDDFVFALPAGIATTTTTTTTAPGVPTTSTTVPAPPARCAPAPVDGCRVAVAPGAAALAARDRRRDAADALAWRWRRGAATAKDDYGDPSATTGFRLCVYDAGGLRASAEVAPGGRCGGRPCWRGTRAGWRFRNPSAVPGGVRALVLVAGADGASRIVASARGADLGLALPFAAPVTVQLLRTDAATCWGARYVRPAKATPARFRATSE